MSHRPEPECVHRFGEWVPKCRLEHLAHEYTFSRMCEACGLVEEFAWARAYEEEPDA